jgi:hypothetical protein
MRTASYLVFGLLLLAFQTAVLAALPRGFAFYDLMIPLAIFLSLFRPLTVGLFVLLLLGFVADMLSAAPNTIFMSVYICIFLTFRNIRGYFHTRDAVFFTFATAAGAVFENLALFLSIVVGDIFEPLPLKYLQVLIVQVLWVFLTAPLVYRMLSSGFGFLDRIRSNLLGSS